MHCWIVFPVSAVSPNATPSYPCSRAHMEGGRGGKKGRVSECLAARHFFHQRFAGGQRGNSGNTAEDAGRDYRRGNGGVALHGACCTGRANGVPEGHVWGGSTFLLLRRFAPGTASAGLRSCAVARAFAVAVTGVFYSGPRWTAKLKVASSCERGSR